jgi:putative glycosyltransferase (TIGR04348 family)
MNITIITPAPRHSRRGNRVSAERWAKLLRSLRHNVHVVDHFDGRCFDAALVLHARRCAPDLRAARKRCPESPVVLCLTGTDVYHDIHHNAGARESLFLADRLLVLQPLAIKQFPRRLRDRARVVYQSVTAPTNPPPRTGMKICVVGHVRDVKDPLRAALATRLLPDDSRIRVVMAGAVLEKKWQKRVAREHGENARFTYAGELPRNRAMRLIASSRAIVVSSLLEGGANVISEACVVGTPVLASRMDGNVGLLGRDYPGLYPVGNTRALARLMRSIETDRDFERDLKQRCKALAPTFNPSREKAALRELLRELASQ